MNIKTAIDQLAVLTTLIATLDTYLDAVVTANTFADVAGKTDGLKAHLMIRILGMVFLLL
jgi:hypothetical protein